MHPNKSAYLVGTQFSSDGTKLIAGDYPGGVVMVWDVSSGKQLVTIETGYGYRGSDDFFFVSPDWQTLFLSREKSSYEQVEKDGKRMKRWEFDGKVLAWDLGSGKLVRTYRHEPARNISSMRLSPDGRMFITSEQLPGDDSGGAKGATSLWDVKTGRPEPLPNGLRPYGLFSPDSRSFATTTYDEENRFARALKLIDVPSRKEKWSVPVKDERAWVHFPAFSPDGALVVVNYRVFDKPKRFDHEHTRLKLLEAATGREVAELVRETNATFPYVRFASDGRTLAGLTWRPPHKDRPPDERKLYLFSVADKRPAQTVNLGTEPKGHRLVARGPVFSPNSKWVAVITQMLPDTSDDLEALDVPQARIHLIDVATGAIRETLIAPQGFPSGGSFSPDGKTLATGGHGRVLLWDVSDLTAGGP